MANLHDNLKTNMAAIVNKAYSEMHVTTCTPRFNIQHEVSLLSLVVQLILVPRTFPFTLGKGKVLGTSFVCM